MEQDYINKDVKYIPLNYGDTIDNIDDCDVVMLDVTAKPDAMDGIIAKAKSVKIFDHHKSAIDDYRNAFDSGSFEGKSLQSINKCACNMGENNFYINFKDSLNVNEKFKFEFVKDNTRSACLMVVNEFFNKWLYVTKNSPVKDRLWYVDHINYADRLGYVASRISDRDTWKFEYPDTRAVYETVAAMNFSYDKFYAWLELPKKDFNKSIETNEIRSNMRLEQANLYAAKAEIIEIDGYKIPCVNVPANYSSEVGSILAKTAPFAMMYVINSKEALLSFRSNEITGISVIPTAKAFGGGGHANASGAKVPLSRLTDLFLISNLTSKKIFKF
jgi:oligoribonuclease NrnB/cAMP/cGMP phosphodiesterase (DHH superfamily)